MSQIKFICRNCKQETAAYDHKQKVFKCSNCGEVYAEQPKLKYCRSCDYQYIEFTWFDPSGCPKCGHSFIE